MYQKIQVHNNKAIHYKEPYSPTTLCGKAINLSTSTFVNDEPFKVTCKQCIEVHTRYTQRRAKNENIRSN